VSLFKPNERLTKQDLYTWANAFYKKDVPQMMTGNATYQDVNDAYFKNKLTLEHPSDELSREQFAVFMASNMNTLIDGKTLFESAGFVAGPIGSVTTVTTEIVGDGEASYAIYSLSINGKVYKVSDHPKVINAPTDLSELKGHKLIDTWINTSDDSISILKADGFNSTSTPVKSEDHHEHMLANSNTKDNTGFLFYVIGGLGVALLLFWLLYKNKK
jgi:hypothetical protein